MEIRWYKWYCINVDSKKELNDKYYFKMYFLFIIPITLVVDWNEKGFVKREYYFLNKLIFKKKYETENWIPNKNNKLT